MKVKTSQKEMERVWFNPKDPAGFGGLTKLSKAAGSSKKQTKTFLQSQIAYTLTKPVRRKYPTRKYKTSGINDLWQLDLMEMIPYAKINDGNKYILTCIDVFSRFARAVALKSKSAVHVSEALRTLFDKVKPIHVQTDLGKEFYNSSVKAIFKEKEINHYSVYSQLKASVVERFNRTLRERLARIFTYNGNKKWITVLPKVMFSYNHSEHRGLHGLKPVDVTSQNEAELWLKQEEDSGKQVKKVNKYKIGDIVRVSKVKGAFLKNFDQNWSDEVFKITNVFDKELPIMYMIEDIDGEKISGKFYQQELQVVDQPSVFRIEKILETKGVGKYKQYYVKWHGYKTPSWISHSNLII